MDEFKPERESHPPRLNMDEFELGRERRPYRLKRMKNMVPRDILAGIESGRLPQAYPWAMRNPVSESASQMLVQHARANKGGMSSRSKRISRPVSQKSEETTRPIRGGISPSLIPITTITAQVLKEVNSRQKLSAFSMSVSNPSNEAVGHISIDKMQVADGDVSPSLIATITEQVLTEIESYKHPSAAPRRSSNPNKGSVKHALNENEQANGGNVSPSLVVTITEQVLKNIEARRQPIAPPSSRRPYPSPLYATPSGALAEEARPKTRPALIPQLRTTIPLNLESSVHPLQWHGVPVWPRAAVYGASRCRRYSPSPNTSRVSSSSVESGVSRDSGYASARSFHMHQAQEDELKDISTEMSKLKRSANINERGNPLYEYKNPPAEEARLAHCAEYVNRPTLQAMISKVDCSGEVLDSKTNASSPAKVQPHEKEGSAKGREMPMRLKTAQRSSQEPRKTLCTQEIDISSVVRPSRDDASSPTNSTNPIDRSSTSESELSFMGTNTSSFSRSSRIKELNQESKRFLTELAEQVVSRCLASSIPNYQPGQKACAPSHHESSSSTSQLSSGDTQPTSLLTPSKRPRQDSNGEQDAGGDEDGERGPDTKRRHRFEDRPTKLFACPYTRYDPERYSERNQVERNYRSCASKFLKDIPRLKQHLYRAHTLPRWYCGNCYNVFTSRKLKDDHDRERPRCIGRHTQYEEMMSDEQYEIIKRRSPGGTPHESWYKIFEILFPGAPKPPTPYVSTCDPVAVQHFVTFFRTHGPEELFNLMRDWRERPESGAVQIATSTQAIVDEAFEIALPDYLERARRQRERPVVSENASSTCREVIVEDQQHGTDTQAGMPVQRLVNETVAGGAETLQPEQERFSDLPTGSGTQDWYIDSSEVDLLFNTYDIYGDLDTRANGPAQWL